MPRVRYTADGGHYRTNGVGFDPGDVRDVGRDLATYLASRDDFERVDWDEAAAEDDDTADAEAAQADGPSEDTTSPDETDSTAAEESADDGAFDVGAFLDRTPVGDIADDIRAGDADGHLDELAAEASRVTVTDAIGERRAELETQSEG